MNRSLFNECTCLFVIIIFNFNVYTNEQIKPNDNPEEFSGDFEVFLKDLGSILNKSKKGPVSETVGLTKHDTLRKTTPSTRSKVFNSQKAALNDVLMMKLVSYYENKYRLALHDPQKISSNTRGNDPERAESSKNNINDDINPVDQVNDKTKDFDTTRINSDHVFNSMETAYSTGAGNVHVNHAAANGPEQTEEVLNAMEYVPLKAGRVGAQNILESRPPTAEKIQKIFDYTSPHFGKVHNVTNSKFRKFDKEHNPNYETMEVENVDNIGDNERRNDGDPVLGYSKQNFNRPRNIQKIENRLSSREHVRSIEEYKYPTLNRALIPNKHNLRNNLENRRTPIRVRNTITDRLRTSGRVRNKQDNAPSEVAIGRHNPEDDRERSVLINRSPYVKKVNMGLTHPNAEGMRIIIGTSPIDKSTVNMGKNSNDYAISEVLVI